MDQATPSCLRSPAFLPANISEIVTDHHRFFRAGPSIKGFVDWLQDPVLDFANMFNRYNRFEKGSSFVNFIPIDAISALLVVTIPSLNPSSFNFLIVSYTPSNSLTYQSWFSLY